jgi:hypothetical protein
MGASVRTACVVIALLALACCGLPLSGQSPNPVPLVNNPLVPTSVAPGGPAFTLTVNGTGFVSGSVVKWNGSARTTHFVSSSQLTVTILGTDIEHPQTASITVLNPSPGGGTSNVAYLQVTSTPPNLVFTTINPNTAPVEQLNMCASGGTDCTVLAVPVFAVGDFNGDGKLDIAIPQNTGNTVSVELGNGDGTFAAAVDYGVGASPNFVLAADFNGDGNLDLAVASGVDESISILLGNGNGTFQSALIVSPGAGSASAPTPKYLAAGDFNRDGKQDLVLASGQTVEIFLGNGDGTFQAPTVLGTTQLGPILDPWNSITGVAVGDFNGDGKLDLAVGLADLPNAFDFHPNFPGVSVVLGNGDGTFQAANLLGINEPVNGIAAADVNGDGKLDLMLGPSGSGNPEIVLGNGDGTFQSPLQTGFPVGKVFAFGDVNGDGKLDMIFSDPTNGLISVALGNGDGTLQNPFNVTAAVPDGAMVAGDFNGDGQLDFVLTNFLSTSSTTSAVTVVLNGPFPSLGVTPNNLVFPAQAVNTTSAPQVITLTNSGLAPIILLGVGLAGTNPEQFLQTNNCLNAILGIGATCQVSVTFTPTQPGLPTAVISLSGNAPGEPLNIPLTGSTPGAGSTGSLSFDPASVTFVWSAAFPAAVEGLTITNNGNSPVTISGVSLTGPDAADFSLSSVGPNVCLVTLPSGGECQFLVTLSTPLPRTQTAALIITSSAVGSPMTVPVTSSMVPNPAPVVTLSPSTITFPSQYVGTSGLPQTLTVTNTGSAALTVTAVTTSGADFGVLSNCGNPVFETNTCTIGVFFDPTAGGTRTGTLKITDNAGNSPQTVTLTGSGLDFSVMPGAAASATVTAGQTASYSIAVAPAGGFAASVALSCSGGPAGSACAVSPSTMALSGAAAQTAMVTVTTAARGWLLPLRGGWPRDTRYRQTPMILTLAAMFLLIVVASQCLRREQNLAWIRVVGFAALVPLGLTLTSCGGGSGSGGGGTNPQAGTYTVTVTGNFTSGATTLNHSAKLTLVVQ